jgi:YD repeat-containing protein
MVIVLSFLACMAPTDAPRGTNPEVARAEEPHPDPRLALEVGPLGPKRWASEVAVGECRIYDVDGQLLSWTTITAAGLPLVRQTTSGNRFTWTRRYRTDGTLAETWVYRRLAGESQELLVHEVHDEAGRLVSRKSGDEETWEYDAAGRLTREILTSPTTRYSREWGYDADGRVARASRRVEWDGFSYRQKSYGWEGDRLVRTWHVRDDAHETTDWTHWHATGAPERGDTEGGNSAGASPPGTVTWTYDAEGHPLTWVGADGVIGTWGWRDGRLVRQQVYDRVQEWDWDESGRLVYQDDGEYVQTWAWADDGDLAGAGWGEHAYTYEGDCPASLFELPEVPTPGPLPVAPKPPRPYGG